MLSEINVDRADSVVTVTLNRPEVKNALTWSGFEEVLNVLRQVDPRQDRTLVLCGAGNDFCSGADLGGPPTGRHNFDDMRILSALCSELFELPVPTVARIDGVAIGAGLNLALACDFVVASTRARFSEIFVRRALSVDAGGSWLLPRLIGLHRAKELVMLGGILDAAAAREMGLVRQVVEPDQLDAAVGALVDELVRAPHGALRQSKAMLNRAFEVGFDQALNEEALAQTLNLSSPDMVEAAEAFAAKRAPDFRPRTGLAAG